MQNHSNQPSSYTYRNETRQRSIQNFGISFTKNVLKFRCFFNLSGPAKFGTIAVIPKSLTNLPGFQIDSLFLCCCYLAASFPTPPKKMGQTWAKISIQLSLFIWGVFAGSRRKAQDCKNPPIFWSLKKFHPRFTDQQIQLGVAWTSSLTPTGWSTRPVAISGSAVLCIAALTCKILRRGIWIYSENWGRHGKVSMFFFYCKKNDAKGLVSLLLFL